MKNRLSDLNNHLFAQMERLSNEKLDSENLKKELERSKAVSAIAKDIVANGHLTLKAQTLIWDRVIDNKEVPRLLQNDQAEDA
jgi:hypothetical protein